MCYPIVSGLARWAHVAMIDRTQLQSEFPLSNMNPVDIKGLVSILNS